MAKVESPLAKNLKVITIPADLLTSTFAIFRECGGARHECVVYWPGPADPPGVVDEVVHPDHSSTYGGHQIDDAWLTAFWFAIARREKSVRVQVHTHPHAAFHSAMDDEWALVHTVGFLSLVIPDFAMGPIGFEDAHLTERDSIGRWQPVQVASRLRLIP